jgi:tRNA G18 (ribose-2'-O)-methylase SpoU
MKREVRIILDNVRSTYNVGSIFRTADAAGVSHISLCGVTPAPIDRFGRKRKDVAKVALGAEEAISWDHFKETTEAIEKSKKEGFQIIAIEQSENSIDFSQFRPKEKVCYLFGTETVGLSAATVDLCDAVVEIPMYGSKESLNVSVSVGIILFNARKDQ